MSYKYKGVNTRRIYEFSIPLVDANGNKVVGGQYSTTTFNGEVVVYANRDGSVARGTAGPGVQVPSSQANIGTVTLPTVTPSPWEMAVPVVPPNNGNDFLLAGLPMTLGNR